MQPEQSAPPTGGREFVLTVSCPDRRGIVHAVSGVMLEQSMTILDSQQFADTSSGEFHLRMHLLREGSPLPVEVPAIVSNHEDFRALAQWHGIPFHHVPVTRDTKPAAEAELRRLVEHYSADTVALARYMQILSGELCTDFQGRIINIHHSLLPSFKGAKPYTQAHDRGVNCLLYTSPSPRDS